MFPAEEKWIAFPVEKKLEFFTIHDRLVEAEKKKIELLGELRKCLLHSWVKSIVGDLKERDERWFLTLVREYYRRLRAGDTEFLLRDVAMPMTVVPYVIEYLEPHFKKYADHTSSWRGSVNPVTSGLYQIRKDHERKINPREEN